MPLTKTREQVAEVTIKVVATMENGVPVIHVEDEVVPLNDLAKALAQYHRKTGKQEVLFDASRDVDWGTVVAVQDAAKKAEIEKVNFLKIVNK